MRSVGLKVLKNKLSEYGRVAAAGERILISDRDRVVAELVPPRATRSDLPGDAVLGQAVRDGLLTPPLQPDGPVPEPPPVATLDEVLRGLTGDRTDR